MPKFFMYTEDGDLTVEGSIETESAEAAIEEEMKRHRDSLKVREIVDMFDNDDELARYVQGYIQKFPHAPTSLDFAHDVCNFLGEWTPGEYFDNDAYLKGPPPGGGAFYWGGYRVLDKMTDERWLEAINHCRAITPT